MCCCVFIWVAYETPRLPPPVGTTGSHTYITIQQPASPELHANTSATTGATANRYLTIIPSGTGDDGYEIPVTASPPRANRPMYENVPNFPRRTNNHASISPAMN